MRLTLRTLLAYMDDILEPEDAQEIAKKIADSPMATELMHRIRDVMRRLRLGAPSVLDQGAGLDPNTVAEYLDNTLSDAQVPDFEKICLESDVHLAEVAACHRILALVLGEPAEVDPSSREKAYHLPEALGANAEEPTDSGPPSLPAETPSGSPRTAPESAPAPAASRIPDYLREPEPAGRRSGVAVGIAAVILVAVGLLALTGRFGGRNLVAELLGTEPSATEQSGDQGAEKATSPGGAAEEALADVDERAKAGVPEATALTSGKTAPGAAETGAAGAPFGKEAGPKGPGPKPTAVPAPDESPPLAPASAGPKQTDVAKTSPRGNDLADKGLVPPPGATDADARRQPPSGEKAPVAAEAARPARQVGYLVSAKEVLLRFDARTGAWRSLAGRAESVSGEKPAGRSASGAPSPPPLFAGDRLLSLPAFRPLIGLSGQAKVQLIGGTLVELLPPDAQSAGGLSIEYGQLMLKAEEAGPARLRLQVGERTGLVSFHDAESTLAIEARRQEAQGGDPETQPGPMIADLYVTSGKIGWQEDADQPPIELEAPVRRVWGERAAEPKVSQQFPKWVYSDTTSPLDQRGALTLERELSGGRPANLVLRELVDFKLREVRSLAVRSLALIGDFEPLLRALDDADQKLYWDDSIEQLRAGVMRRPASAAAVRSAMERFYGAAGARLYEMLWKYGQPLQAADSQQLIDYLDHQALAFRVVALWNLKNAYGMTLQYRPEDPAAKRQVAVQRWRERLKSGLTPRGASPLRGGKVVPPEAPPVGGTPAARENL